MPPTRRRRAPGPAPTPVPASEPGRWKRGAPGPGPSRLHPLPRSLQSALAPGHLVPVCRVTEAAAPGKAPVPSLWLLGQGGVGGSWKGRRRQGRLRLEAGGRGVGHPGWGHGRLGTAPSSAPRLCCVVGPPSALGVGPGRASTRPWPSPWLRPGARPILPGRCSHCSPSVWGPGHWVTPAETGAQLCLQQMGGGPDGPLPILHGLEMGDAGPWAALSSFGTSRSRARRLSHGRDYCS